MELAAEHAAEASSICVWRMPGGDGACFVQRWPGGSWLAFASYEEMEAATADLVADEWEYVLVSERVEA